MALDETAPRLRSRLAAEPGDLARAQALRHRAFLARGGGPAGRDSDAWDAVFRHVLIEEAASGDLLCTFRYRLLSATEAASSSYTGRHYDLAAWTGLPGPLLEVGRFCLAARTADPPDPDVLRAAWGEIARLVVAEGVTLLFGCSSFRGADPARHQGSLGLLRRHAAPAALAPGRRAPETADLPVAPADPVAAARGLPALLRSYLAMGGWVSDHAVIDRTLDTLHVLTAVEVARIPAARARSLRALA